MKFSAVLTIAILLTVVAIYEKHFSSSFLFALILYVLLGTLLPFIMIPLGVVAIIWLIYVGNLRTDITKPIKF